MKSILTLAVCLISILALANASAITLVWPNGGFELGDAGWTYPPSTQFGDFDDSGDQEVFLDGSGEGTWQLSRGVTKGVVPANIPFSFVVKQGTFTYDIRMVLLSATDPDPWANNLYGLDPTGTLAPDWSDDQVLSWTGSASGPGTTVLLRPEEANGINIPGWQDMTPEERSEELSTYLHMTIVIYGIASGFNGGATLDDFAWEL